jgi:uncharacterized protein YbaR (Trm112 family)
MATIRRELLEILACPETKAPLVLTKDGDLLSTDAQSRRLYRDEDGIPVLLISESTVLEPEEYQRQMAAADKPRPTARSKKG